MMIKLNKILVPTDFSEASDTAFRYGHELARKFSAQLYLMHVVEMPMMWSAPEGVAFDMVTLQGDLENAAREKLAAVVGVDPDVPTVTAVRTAASAAFAIVDYAKDAQVDVVVIATHGRGAIGHLLIGSVAEKVVRLAPCPVLTVRTPELDFVVPDALQTATVARM